jgi:hypothetical protein
MEQTNMVNNYQSLKRLENDNKHRHGEHLGSKKPQKKDDEHGHHDHLTLNRKKYKMITSVNTMNT